MTASSLEKEFFIWSATMGSVTPIFSEIVWRQETIKIENLELPSPVSCSPGLLVPQIPGVYIGNVAIFCLRGGPGLENRLPSSLIEP